MDAAPCRDNRSSLFTARFDEIEWLGLKDTNLRAANRDRLNPGNRDNGLGFRVGRTLTP